jgi:hypothetical protein
MEVCRLSSGVVGPLERASLRRVEMRADDLRWTPIVGQLGALFKV